MYDKEQYYPTPISLAIKMVHKFKNRDFSQVLEPSAGDGSLLTGFPQHYNSSYIDVCEINGDRIEGLREKDYNVVGYDFLELNTDKQYSHIIMNPPFNQGAKHVLKALELLKNGELVAILNANTLDPSDKYAQKLSEKLHELDADIEYIEEAFTSEETQRKTKVKIALIHVIKKTESTSVDEIIDGLKISLDEDKTEQLSLPEDKTQSSNMLALNEGQIPIVVRTFNLAKEALKKEMEVTSYLQSQTAYYREMLGHSLDKTDEEKNHEVKMKDNVKDFQKEFNKNYKDLKKSAWSLIIERLGLRKKLSSKVFDSIVADLNNMSKFDFTETNIHGFLSGVYGNMGKLQDDMMEDIFDRITQYDTANRCWYEGWKSNDKHKENAYRISTKRFIMPLTDGYGWDWGGCPWSIKEKLADFDKSVDLLNGKKYNPLRGIAALFDNDETLEKLKWGDTLETENFKVKFYRGKKTAHISFLDQDMADKLNRRVGRIRNWIPKNESDVNDNFWKQYDDAEKITRKMAIKNMSYWEMHNEPEKLIEKHNKTCEDMGYDLNFTKQLESK